MKGLVLENAGQARVANLPEPKAALDQLLLRVDMVGLCGSDLNSFRGRNPLVTYPRVLSHEIAATVLTGTREIPVGTRVTVSPYRACGTCSACRQGRENACRNNETLGVQRDGAIAELQSIPSAKIYPAPSLSTKELCIVEPLTVGFHAIKRGRVTEADTVAVFGCGGIGLGAIAGAAYAGARTIAIDLDEQKLATAAKAGASECVHSLRENTRDRLLELTDGEGPAVVIEAIGLPETFRLAVEAVCFAGRVVYIGYAKEPVAYETKLFVQKELDILGSRNALPEDFHKVLEMLGKGHFPTDDAVTAVVTLQDAPAVLEQWSRTPAAFTKIMIDMH